MHPELGKGFNTNSLENAKFELTETQRDNLVLLDQELTKLLESIYKKGGEGTINHFNAQILKQQERDTPNEALIDGYKAELMGAYMPHYERLIYFVRNDLPQALSNYLDIMGVNLKSFPGEMRDSILEFMRQDIIEAKSQRQANAFFLPDWLETVQKVQLAVKKLL
jgi:hypothetical protein